MFTTAPILWHYNTNLLVRLETDVSGFTISGILSQQVTGDDPEAKHWHPITFWSRQMLPAEWNYHTGQHELLAIVMACKHWWHYLDGADTLVNVLSDHGNLRNFMTMKELTGRLAWWWELLSGFRINIVWCLGKENPADGLLRSSDYKTWTPETSVGYIRPLQAPMLMSRAAKCQLRKIHLEGGDMESEQEDSTGVIMFTTSHVLDQVMFAQVRLVATWQGPYLDLMRSLSAIIANVQGADPLAIKV